MRTAVQFSGGKDSLAVLHLMRGRFDSDTTVYFGDTGIAYPHIARFVAATCAAFGLRLKVVKPTVSALAFHAKQGLPADIVPVECSAEMQPYLSSRREPLLQSGLSCCSALLWRPLQEALLADGVRVVYRGSKKCDGQVGVADGFVDAHGIIYRSPLWDWSEKDVFDYLKAAGAELPAHYAQVNSSFDCYACTAWLNHTGVADRLAWTREAYPELWPEIETRLRRVREALDRERAGIDAALNLAGTGSAHRSSRTS